LGYEIYHSMTRYYGIETQMEHYGCMVDLLGCVGRLEEAYDFIREMKIAPDHIIFGALLSACKMRGNTEIGESVQLQKF
jgi:pentatricopeptide repeat protein